MPSMPRIPAAAARLIAQRPRTGRPPAALCTEDAALVARACGLYGGLSFGELAKLAGVGRSGLSRERLPASTREKLVAMVAAKSGA